MSLRRRAWQRQFLKCMHLQLTKSYWGEFHWLNTKRKLWNGKEEKCTRWIKLLFSVQQDVLGIIWVESVKFTAGQKHDARRCDRWYVDKKLEHVCMCQFRKCRGNLIPIAVVIWVISCLEYTKWKDCTTQYSLERVLK